jgi:hypothetical protein
MVKVNEFTRLIKKMDEVASRLDEEVVMQIGSVPYEPHASFFPFTKLAIEHWKLVQNSRLKRKEKIIAFLDIILRFLLKYKALLSDLVFTQYLNLSKLRK